MAPCACQRGARRHSRKRYGRKETRQDGNKTNTRRKQDENNTKTSRKQDENKTNTTRQQHEKEKTTTTVSVLQKTSDDAQPESNMTSVGKVVAQSRRKQPVDQTCRRKRVVTYQFAQFPSSCHVRSCTSPLFDGGTRRSNCWGTGQRSIHRCRFRG